MGSALGLILSTGGLSGADVSSSDVAPVGVSDSENPSGDSEACAAPMTEINDARVIAPRQIQIKCSIVWVLAWSVTIVLKSDFNQKLDWPFRSRFISWLCIRRNTNILENFIPVNILVNFLFFGSVYFDRKNGL